MCQCFLLAVSFNIYMYLPRHKAVGAVVRLNTNSTTVCSHNALEQVRIFSFSLKKIIAYIDVCCKVWNEAVVLLLFFCKLIDLKYHLYKAPPSRQKANLALKYPRFILAATDSQKFNLSLENIFVPKSLIILTDTIKLTRNIDKRNIVRGFPLWES